MLAEMSSAEFEHWMAFEALEPFGPLHDEFLAGQICQVTANVNRDPKRRNEPFGAQDFMPALEKHLAEYKSEPEEKPLSDEQRAAFLDAAFFGIGPA